MICNDSLPNIHNPYPLHKQQIIVGQKTVKIHNKFLFKIYFILR